MHVEMRTHAYTHGRYLVFVLVVLVFILKCGHMQFSVRKYAKITCGHMLLPSGHVQFP